MPAVDQYAPSLQGPVGEHPVLPRVPGAPTPDHSCQLPCTPVSSIATALLSLKYQPLLLSSPDSSCHAY